MRVTVTGATGLIGGHVMRALIARGDEVVPVSTSADVVGGVPAVRWDPTSAPFPPAATDGVDAVVNLAGASVADGRWTDARKQIIRDSRVVTTTRIAEALAAGAGPRVLVNGSASGVYGNRGDEVLDEESAPGRDFLSDVAQAWEAAAQGAEAGGVRVVLSRTGMVLAPDGGVIPRLAKIARAGGAGPIAGGKQWVPWVGIADVVGMILRALDDDSWSGPVNVCAPEPMRQRDVAHALGHAVGRPAKVPTPGFMLKASMGEMAVLVLDSQRCVPRIATSLGYTWAHPDVASALAAALTD
jgi:uncharacterized protein (TIGR01777 family)